MKTCKNCRYWKKGWSTYPREVKKWWQFWKKSQPEWGLCKDSRYYNSTVGQERHGANREEYDYCQRWKEKE